MILFGVYIEMNARKYNVDTNQLGDWNTHINV